MYYLHKIIFHSFRILLTSRALRFIVKDIRHKVLNFIWVDQTSAMPQWSKIWIKYNCQSNVFLSFSCKAQSKNTKKCWYLLGKNYLSILITYLSIHSVYLNTYSFIALFFPFLAPSTLYTHSRQKQKLDSPFLFDEITSYTWRINECMSCIVLQVGKYVPSM